MPTSALPTSGLTERERMLDRASLNVACRPLTLGPQFGRAKFGALWVNPTAFDLIRQEFRRLSSQAQSSKPSSTA
jgi:hypothetical protein